MSSSQKLPHQRPVTAISLSLPPPHKVSTPILTIPKVNTSTNQQVKPDKPISTDISKMVPEATSVSPPRQRGRPPKKPKLEVVSNSKNVDPKADKELSKVETDDMRPDYEQEAKLGKPSRVNQNLNEKWFQNNRKPHYDLFGTT